MTKWRFIYFLVALKKNNRVQTVVSQEYRTLSIQIYVHYAGEILTVKKKYQTEREKRIPLVGITAYSPEDLEQNRNQLFDLRQSDFNITRTITSRDRDTR
jgi:hypothetical protein